MCTLNFHALTHMSISIFRLWQGLELWEAKYSGEGQLEVLMAQPEAEDTEKLFGSPIFVRFLIKFWRL